MPVTINGTTGVVTPGATIGSINGILKSSSGVVSQASVGTDYSQLTLATAQTASGTLTQIRLSSATPDTFDAGTINISYE
jgi:hypothetical protein